MARAPTDLRSLARAHTTMCLKSLATIAQRGKSESARVTAAGLLLERGWGKAPSTIAGADGDGSIQVIVRHILEGSSSPRPAAATIEHRASDNSVIRG